jgi:hypothetical protein
MGCILDHRAAVGLRCRGPRTSATGARILLLERGLRGGGCLTLFDSSPADLAGPPPRRDRTSPVGTTAREGNGRFSRWKSSSWERSSAQQGTPIAPWRISRGLGSLTCKASPDATGSFDMRRLPSCIASLRVRPTRQAGAWTPLVVSIVTMARWVASILVRLRCAPTRKSYCGVSRGACVTYAPGTPTSGSARAPPSVRVGLSDG